MDAKDRSSSSISGDASYEKTDLNTVNRMKERGHYDHSTVHAIVREAPFVHVAFIDPDGMPQCIPMIGAIVVEHKVEKIIDADEELEEQQQQAYVYLHGHAKARLIQMLPHGTRVCLTATLLDGLVLSLVAFHHSMNYRSAVLHGEVEEIDDGSGSDGGLDGERWEAGKQVVEKVLPGRWEDARQPTKAEMKATGFVKVKILSASAKIRQGMPKEDKADRENEELLNSTWTGVIPVKQVLGEPLPAEINRVQQVPDYIRKVAPSQ